MDSLNRNRLTSAKFRKDPSKWADGLRIPKGSRNGLDRIDESGRFMQPPSSSEIIRIYGEAYEKAQSEG